MKLRQLIDNNIDIFLKKNHTQNVVERLVSDSSIKIEHIFGLTV